MIEALVVAVAVAFAAAGGVVLGRWIQYRTDETVLINSLRRQLQQRAALERVVANISEGRTSRALQTAKEAIK